MDPLKFENIRPYNDEEVKDAVLRIASSPYLDHLFDYLYPGEERKKLKAEIAQLNTVWDFQSKIMAKAINRVITMTSDGVEYSGLENIESDKRYLLLSNHRDIILDPAIIQVIFYENNIATTEIAVGDNLISSSFIEDIIRSNRMIKVIRGVASRELYESSMLLSEYIRDSITSSDASIWLAQRSGRTKDGLDVTGQGVLKMLSMSGGKDFVKSFSELNILPISISYQIEPCDFLKAREIYITKRQKYVKSENEDLVSILTGVKQYKGGIDITFSPRLDDNIIEELNMLDKNERFTALGTELDKIIRSSYKLWNTNYMAQDILYNKNQYEEHYTQEELAWFMDYYHLGLNKIIESEKSMKIDYWELENIFLSIYANAI